MTLGLVVSRVSGDFQQVVVYGSDIAVYGNVVVVEDDKDISLAGSCVVQTFECQTSAERTVSDQGD